MLKGCPRVWVVILCVAGVSPSHRTCTTFCGGALCVRRQQLLLHSVSWPTNGGLLAKWWQQQSLSCDRQHGVLGGRQLCASRIGHTLHGLPCFSTSSCLSSSSSCFLLSIPSMNVHTCLVEHILFGLRCAPHRVAWRALDLTSGCHALRVMNSLAAV